MKKITSISLAAFALAIVFSGCTKTEMTPSETAVAGHGFSLYTQITRTTNDGVHTNWAAADGINVFHAAAGSSEYSANSKFAITAENLEAGIFTGDLAGELSASNDWYALYPYNSAITTPEGNASGYVTIGSVTAQIQTGNSSTAHLAGAGIPLYAQAKGVAEDGKVALAFKPAVSVVKIHVTNDTEAAITVTDAAITGREELSGDFTMNFVGDEPVYTAVYGRSSYKAYLNVKNGTAIAAGESADFYIAVKPSKIDEGNTWKLSVNGIEKSSTAAVEFKRGNIKTLNFSYDTEQIEVKKVAAFPTSCLCNNTLPVFSTDYKVAYMVTRAGSNVAKMRNLYAINLEDATVKWSYPLTHSTVWTSNGGNICVNPGNGDIICSNQCDLFAVTSEGAKHWSVANFGGVAASNNAPLLLGSGPAMSNDNSVIFAPCKNGLYAVNAETGAIVDSIKFNSNISRIQFAVYGDNKIVAHTHPVTAQSLLFAKYENNEFTNVKRSASVIPDMSDLTCPVITADQTKAYFFGRKTGSPAYGLTVCVDLTTQTVSATDNFSDHGAGFRWSGALTEDGWLAYTSVFNGSNAAVGVMVNGDLGQNSFIPVYKYAGTSGSIGNSAFNYEGVVADREGTIYFMLFDWDKKVNTTTAKNYFIRSYFTGAGYHTQTVGSIDCAAGKAFQGAFAFGGHYLVAVQGNPGVVQICKLPDTVERAHAWANGGDAQGTKNANRVYAK